MLFQIHSVILSSLCVYTGFLQMPVYDCIWSLFESVLESTGRTRCSFCQNKNWSYAAFHSFPIRDDWQISAVSVFVQVCLHTVKRNGNVRTTHHLDSEVHCFKDESRCFVDLTVLHTQNFLPSSINLLSFFTNEAVSTLINNLFTCISCILLPRFSISNTRLNSLCFLEDEKHDGTFRILSVCLLHDCSEPWSAGDQQLPLLVITWLRWWRIQFAMQLEPLTQLGIASIVQSGRVGSLVVREKKSCGSSLAAFHTDKHSFIVLTL